ncbi:MAG: HlyD family efflux transporter periplasmic adaptor subunit [Planctomycetes bacterium]|nr:HlyD family efflux transporter periplasmic adaptor subunit [Planctomycetota bacterium]
MFPRLIALAVIAAALIGALYYAQHRAEPLKVSGFIEADEIRLGSRVGGRVKRVDAVEGHRVKPGDVLIELEPYDLLHKRDALRAQRAQLAANLDKLVAGPRKQDIEAARAYVQSAEAERDLAQLNFERIKKSFDAKAASPDELDKATENLKSASAMVEVRRQQLAQLEEGTRKEDLTEARAALDAADANLAAIDAQICELEVASPVPGEIEAVDLQPGDMVTPNAPVLSLLDLSHLWIRAYLPENLMRLEPGDKVDVTVDSFPGRKFKAHISFVAQQAEFTPGNVQTPEDRSKQVFRIKVVLEEGIDLLRPGMNADVWLPPPPTPEVDHSRDRNAAPAAPATP